MKKKTLLATLMVATLSVSALFGCGYSTEESKSPAETAAPAEAVTDPVTEAPTEAATETLGDVYFKDDVLQIVDGKIEIQEVKVKEADTEMGEEKPTLVVKYAFTNTSEDPLAAGTFWIACFTAKQDGGDTIDELDVAMAPQGEEYETLNENAWLELKPGKTIESVISYEIKYPGEPVTLIASQGMLGDELGTKVVETK